MTTLVGKQVDFTKALQELIALDDDAVEAYEAAINRLESSEFKSKLSNFKMDHQRHITEIADILRNHNVPVPTSQEQINEIIDLVKSIKGVKEVNMTQLTIKKHK